MRSENQFPMQLDGINSEPAIVQRMLTMVTPSYAGVEMSVPSTPEVGLTKSRNSSSSDEGSRSMKLSTLTGSIAVETGFGTFVICNYEDGIAVYPPRNAPTLVLNSSTLESFGLKRGGLQHVHTLIDVPPTIPAFIDGPKLGKGAKTIRGTISRDEFITAYGAYLKRGGLQHVHTLIDGGGFSIQELEQLLGHCPHSWVEEQDKLEGGGRDIGQAGGEKLLQQKDELEDSVRPLGNYGVEPTTATADEQFWYAFECLSSSCLPKNGVAFDIRLSGPVPELLPTFLCPVCSHECDCGGYWPADAFGYNTRHQPQPGNGVNKDKPEARSTSDDPDE
jgi:hypothetical protein